jgi:hypothetical protein
MKYGQRLLIFFSLLYKECFKHFFLVMYRCFYAIEFRPLWKIHAEAAALQATCVRVDRHTVLPMEVEAL